MNCELVWDQVTSRNRRSVVMVVYVLKIGVGALLLIVMVLLLMIEPPMCSYGDAVYLCMVPGIAPTHITHKVRGVGIPMNNGFWGRLLRSSLWLHMFDTPCCAGGVPKCFITSEHIEPASVILIA